MNMTRIISFINHKGGVGKTTSCVSIGAGLASLKKKVLLIDLDPQANLTAHFGLSMEEKQNIYTAMSQKKPQGLPMIHFNQYIDIVTSTLDLSAVDIELNNRPAREYILKKLVEPIQENYDFILIDCPPALGLLTINALSYTDEIIIPIDFAKFALNGMNRIIEVVDMVRDNLNGDLKGYTILLTKRDKRTVIHQDIQSQIEKAYEGMIFKTCISKNIAVEEAQMNEVDIFTYDENCVAAKDYLDVCEEILKQKNKWLRKILQKELKN